jgi:hypothetical protein
VGSLRAVTVDLAGEGESVALKGARVIENPPWAAGHWCKLRVVLHPTYRNVNPGVGQGGRRYSRPSRASDNGPQVMPLIRLPDSQCERDNWQQTRRSGVS